MASSGIYKRISQLIEKWPIDKSKSGRDLGQYLRDYINQAQREGKFAGNEQYWDRQYLALRRLLNNEHNLKYNRELSSSSTGLTGEQCNTILKTETLELIEKENTSFIKRVFSSKKQKEST